MAKALLLLDLQEGLCRSDGLVGGPSGLGRQAELRDVLSHAATALEIARSKQISVLFVKVAFDPNYLLRLNRGERFGSFETRQLFRKDSDEASICREIQPLPEEVVIEKGCVDPFIGTPLLEVLIGRGVDELFLGGVATNFVVESAARHAGDMGFRVSVVEPMCAAHDQTMHRFAIEKTLPLFARCILSMDEFSASIG